MFNNVVFFAIVPLLSHTQNCAIAWHLELLSATADWFICGSICKRKAKAHLLENYKRFLEKHVLYCKKLLAQQWLFCIWNIIYLYLQAGKNYNKNNYTLSLLIIGIYRFVLLYLYCKTGIWKKYLSKCAVCQFHQARFNCRQIWSFFQIFL